MASQKKTVDVRVEGEMSVEIILSLPSQGEKELLEKAKRIVREALKQALNDIPEIADSVEAYCEPYQELNAEIDN